MAVVKHFDFNFQGRSISPFYIGDHRHNSGGNNSFGTRDFSADDIPSNVPIVNTRVPAGAENLFTKTEKKKKKKKKKSMGRNWNRSNDWERGSSIQPGRLPSGSTIQPGRLPPGSTIQPGRIQSGSSIQPGRLQSGSSIQPVWKIRKVMNERDMDTFDDDIRPSRISRRASPPPPPPEPTRQQRTSLVKQEGRTRPEDLAIFQNVVERSWDARSSFLEDTPVRRGSFPLHLPGLSSDDVHADEKPLRSILRNKPEGMPSSIRIKEEAEDVPMRKYTIPGLDIENMDDEDRFLYGDERNESGNIGSRSIVNDQRNAANSIPSNESRERENSMSWDAVDDRSSSQSKIDQAKLESFLKSIGLNIDSNRQGTSSQSPMNKDIAQRGAQVAQTLMNYFNDLRNEPKSSTPDRQPIKKEPPDAFVNYPSSSSTAYATLNSRPDLNTSTAERYSTFPLQSPASAPAVPYANYNPYEGYYDGSYPQPIQQPVPPPLLSLQTYSVNPPSNLYQPYPLPLNMIPPATPTLKTPQATSSSRSNLKVIPLQSSSGVNSTTENKKPAATKPAAPSKGTAVSGGHIKVPTNVEERRKLRQSHAQLKKKLDLLIVELERLRKQQGELMRKKQRQKDGHNDPLLLQNSSVQEDIQRQVYNLKKDLDLMEKALAASMHLADKASDPSSSRFSEGSGKVSGLN